MKSMEAGALAQKKSVLSSRQNWISRLKGYISGLTLVWLSIAAYHYLSYYRGFLSTTTQQVLFVLAIGYSLYILAFYFFASSKQVKESKALMTTSAVFKICTGIVNFVSSGPHDYTQPLSQVTKAEKRALLFAIVKFFFIPLMLEFLVTNYDGLKEALHTLNYPGLFTISGFNSFIFPLLLSLLILIDTAFFTFGYIFEARFLKSSLRSVEPTILGWSVALICYPPFNGFLGTYVPWYANDYAAFTSTRVTFFMRLVVLLLLGFYASASVALGPKASNLTNRGIVGHGPYRVIRHPAYISKNLAWWLTILPGIGLAAIFSMAIWSFIYFMRAITEERHLSADPDYVAYCQKVKYRFIPGLI